MGKAGPAGVSRGLLSLCCPGAPYPQAPTLPENLRTPGPSKARVAAHDRSREGAPRERPQAWCPRGRPQGTAGGAHRLAQGSLRLMPAPRPPLLLLNPSVSVCRAGVPWNVPPPSAQCPLQMQSLGSPALGVSLASLRPPPHTQPPLSSLLRGPPCTPQGALATPHTAPGLGLEQGCIDG